MLCLHPCLPCWTQPKTCVLACPSWCPVDCICLPHLFIALSLPPTHRYVTYINFYIQHVYIWILYLNFVCLMLRTQQGQQGSLQKLHHDTKCLEFSRDYCYFWDLHVVAILLPSGTSAICAMPDTYYTRYFFRTEGFLSGLISGLKIKVWLTFL